MPNLDDLLRQRARELRDEVVRDPDEGVLVPAEVVVEEDQRAPRRQPPLHLNVGKIKEKWLIMKRWVHATPQGNLIVFEYKDKRCFIALSPIRMECTKQELVELANTLIQHARELNLNQMLERNGD